VKRLLISMSVLLLLASLGLETTSAQQTSTTILHQAIVDGDIDQVESLISKGADMNSKNYMGWTPLHTAIQNRQKAIAEFLIDKGADLNAKAKNEKTPLHFAVESGQKDVVELLIAKGADVNTMSGRNENALSLAKKKGHKEIVDLLVKHGAKEPIVEDLEGDSYYRGQSNLQPNQVGGIQPQGITGTAGQSPAEVDILADPNEIRARIKTFKDLEKALEEVAGKSKIEMHHWEQKKYDNRTNLAKAVQKQVEDEIGFIRKIAVEEKAKKTTEAIDSLLSSRKKRSGMVNKELLEQQIELKQMQSPRGRSRGRSSGRSTRGRYPQRGQQSTGNITEPLYDRSNVMTGTSRNEGVSQPSEQIDKETENEIRQWLQATIDNREDLAKALHQQIRAEITSVRKIAVEEKAKKTTAAIDGLLLARQERFEKFTKKIEEEKKALQQTQDPRSLGSGRYPQGGLTEQENQPRKRVRRR